MSILYPSWIFNPSTFEKKRLPGEAFLRFLGLSVRNAILGNFYLSGILYILTVICILLLWFVCFLVRLVLLGADVRACVETNIALFILTFSRWWVMCVRFQWCRGSGIPYSGFTTFSMKSGASSNSGGAPIYTSQSRSVLYCVYASLTCRVLKVMPGKDAASDSSILWGESWAVGPFLFLVCMWSLLLHIALLRGYYFC